MSSSRPLDGQTVVDLGAGMAAALAAKYLRESGAELVRIEPSGGDPFHDVYPAYEMWRRGARLERAVSEQRLEQLLAAADVCIIGGEDYPGFARRSDAARLLERHPRLVVLDIEGYPSGTKHSGRPACDLLVQARSGLSYEHYSTRPNVMGFEPSSYGAALHGLCGVFAALIQRESSGRGSIVSTSLFEGVIAWTTLLWCEAERPTPASRFVMPKDPWPLIFQCADGIYVQIVLGSAGSKWKLYRILGIDDPTVGVNDSGMPKPTADVKNFFGDVDLLARHVARRPSQELLEAIWAEGLPAEPVLPPGGCWDDPQVRHNGIIVRDPDGIRHVGHPISARTTPATRISLRAPGCEPRPPLAGIKVIDFGTFVAGPYSSVVLADLGADVIKVDPITGDPNRSVFRSWTAANRGKRCISLDLKSPEGLKIARQLCSSADVVTNNFRPGVSARLGIDADSLHALAPGLIVLEAGAYGSTGPRAQGAGFDMCFQALCGHDWRAGGIGNAPLWNRSSFVDFASGLLGAVAILEHLYARTRTGAAAALGSSLLDTGIYLLSQLIQKSDGSFEGAPPLNSAQTGYHPAEQLYRAADGWLAIAARDEAMAGRLLDALELRQAIGSPRAAWGDPVAAAIAGRLRSRRIAELTALLEKYEVWAEACCPDGEQNLRDEELVQAGTVYRAQHPQLGEVRQIGPLVRLSGSSPAARRHAPLPGQDTDAILAELGYAGTEIGSLRERKIVI